MADSLWLRKLCVHGGCPPLKGKSGQKRFSFPFNKGLQSHTAGREALEGESPEQSLDQVEDLYL